jgi:hypothetical protein
MPRIRTAEEEAESLRDSELARQLGECARRNGINRADAVGQRQIALHCTATRKPETEAEFIDRVSGKVVAEFMAKHSAQSAKFAAEPDATILTAGGRGHLPRFDEHEKAGELPYFGEADDDDEQDDRDAWKVGLSAAEINLVEAHRQQGVEQGAAAVTAAKDWKHMRRLTCGTGRRTIPLARFLAASPAMMAVTGEQVRFVGR